MNNNDLFSIEEFKVLNEGSVKPVTSVYCSDLLSSVMGRAKSETAWVTVMGNINAVAVAVLADISVIVLAGNAAANEDFLSKAQEEGITVISSSLPIFETALKIHEAING